MSGYTITNPTNAPTIQLTNKDGLDADTGVVYRVSFVTHFGETLAGPASNSVTIPDFPPQVKQVFTKSNFGATAIRNFVSVTGIAIAENPNVIKRKLYRINGATVSLVKTFNNNTDTEFLDTAPIGFNTTALPVANTANSRKIFRGDIIFNNVNATAVTADNVTADGIASTNITSAILNSGTVTTASLTSGALTTSNLTSNLVTLNGQALVVTGGVLRLNGNPIEGGEGGVANPDLLGIYREPAATVTVRTGQTPLSAAFHGIGYQTEFHGLIKNQIKPADPYGYVFPRDFDQIIGKAIRETNPSFMRNKQLVLTDIITDAASITNPGPQFNSAKVIDFFNMMRHFKWTDAELLLVSNIKFLPGDLGDRTGDTINEMSGPLRDPVKQTNFAIAFVQYLKQFVDNILSNLSTMATMSST